MNEAKSQLAKLLAQEGVEVVHDPKMDTAAFDPKKRILYLPVLKEMSGDVYDLFVLHEVGHALYTPEDGFHSTPEDKGQRYKGFLNVVEDARIEKKIKRKYPGGRSNMIRGYHNLMDRDFFGVKHMDPNKLGMIDRFNLYFKCGLALNIKFSDEEMEFVDRGRSLESWDDVLDLVEDLWEYAENEEATTDLQEMLTLSTEEGEDYTDQDWEYEDAEHEETDEEMDGSGKMGPEAEGEEGEEEQKDDHRGQKEGGSFANEDHNITQESFTDKNFREKEQELVNLDVGGDFHYVNVPELDPTMFVCDYKTVIDTLIKSSEDIVEHRKGRNYMHWHWNNYQWDSFEHFNQVNKPIVSYMVKEFEMRKSANLAKRAKISKTGILNTSSLYKYKIDDKIFKSVLHTPEGKNHGLVFYIDFSGSMNTILPDVIAQSVLMAMFCRQVKIPYRIYGFTNGFQNKMGQILAKQWEHTGQAVNRYSIKRAEGFLNFKDGDVGFDTSLCLYEMFSDRQSSGDFQRIARALIEHPKYGSSPVPMGGTPLNEAILNGIALCRQFRKAYNLDIVNTIFMTDGDSSSDNRYYGMSEHKDEFGPYKHFNIQRDTVYVKDRTSNEQIVMKRGMGRHYGWMQTKKYIELYKRATGSNTVFMNIVNRIEYYSGEKANMHWYDLKEKIRKDGWYRSDDEGVDAIFTILSRAFKIKTDAEEKFDKVEAGGKIGSVRSAYKNMNRNRMKQRFLVGNFIQQIA